MRKIQRGWNVPIDLKAALKESVRIGRENAAQRKADIRAGVVKVKRPNFNVRTFPRTA